ncbi:MAG: leucine-rich repeat domain-containing protein [Clostridia bacterium]|nr:leucine-rich repeat domain-containing protein [Clostridia bacterium]
MKTRRILSMLLCICMLAGTVLQTGTAYALTESVTENIEEISSYSVTETNDEITEGTELSIASTGSSIVSTWNTVDVAINEGEEYYFIGSVSTTAENGLKDLQININSATDDTVGIKYFRSENIGAESFDLSEVPALTVNAELSDEDQTIVLAPDTTWEVQLWATDTDGNSIGASEIMILTISGEYIISGDFTYTVNDDGETATITGFVGEESGDLIIPSEIDGYTVTSIGDYAFYNCSGFTGTLMIPDSVTSIGSYAFEDCDGFTGSLVLPDSLSFIGESSFFSCSGFTGSLTIPDSVTTIGKYAFSHCSGFTGDLMIPDSVTSISKGTFSYCSGFVGDLMIPDSVTTIGDYAFSSCSGFTGFLTIPDSVTTIGDYAFSECTGLTGTLTIPDSVTTLGEGAFLFCENFTGTLIISDSVTSIEYATFVGCSGFTGTLTIPESVTTIGDCAFRDCAGFTGSLIIPDGVTTIGDYSFEGCTGFTGTLTMPDSVTFIGDYSFSWCEGLTEISIPDKVTSVGNHVFDGCIRLEKISLPDSIISIGEYAFYRCESLTEIDIPDRVTSIGNEAFRACYMLDRVSIPNGLTTIGNYAFYDCDFIEEIIIPDSLTSIGGKAYGACDSLQTVHFNGNVPSIWGETVLPEEVVIYYPEGNTSGWTSPTWTAPDGTVYNTMTFNPNGSSITSTWDTTAVTLNEGEEYSFVGSVSTTAENGLKDLQININSATDDTVGIKYYRAENIGTESFDLSTVPVLTVNAELSDEDQTIVLAPGTTWKVQLFATDTDGNAIGDAEIMILAIDEEEISDSIYWDGSIAKSFAGGIGTENDPYRIETAAQLVYFIMQIASGVTYENENIILVNDIVLNKVKFSYDVDTSMIICEEPNGNVLYYQTGNTGWKIENGNTQFDENKYEGWYSFNAETNEYVLIEGYTHTLNIIDNSYYVEGSCFKGSFNGNQKCIYGIASFQSGLYCKSLFYNSYGEIKNLNIANSAISSVDEGVIANSNYGTIDNCHVDAVVVVSSGRTGGLAGSNSGIIKNSTYNGIIRGGTYTGGIAGRSQQDIINCTNYGDIYASENVGGITGYLYTRSSANASDSTLIENCKNYGSIYGSENTGGICGLGYNEAYKTDSILKIENAHNYAEVSGVNNVSGILGYLESEDALAKTYITNCSNWGNVFATESYVGGIIGYKDISNNLRSDYLRVQIIRCFNNGNIVGNSYVGGLIGYSEPWYWCIVILEDCYNSGTISGNSYVSGIVSEVLSWWMAGIRFSNIYNIGTITSLDANIGAIACKFQNYGTTILENLYFNSVLNGIVETDIEDDSEVVNIIGYTDAELQNSSSYINFDFDTVWEIGVTEGYPYPTLRDNPHVKGSDEPSVPDDPEIPEVPSEITSTWDTTSVTLNEGEEYSFVGSVSTTAKNGLKDLQININSATDDTVGIMHFRAPNIGLANFDLSAVQSLTVNATLSDDEQTIVLAPGTTWEVQLFATDTDGNSIGDAEIMILTIAEAEVETGRPTITGLSNSYTITLGESLTLEGTISAFGEGRLNKVTLQHNEEGSTFVPQTQNIALASATADLSYFTLSADEYPLNTVGTHEFIIYASADNFTDTDNRIMHFNVTVNPAEVEEPTDCQHNWVFVEDVRNSGIWENLNNGTHKRVSVEKKYGCSLCGATKVEREPDSVIEPHTTYETREYSNRIVSLPTTDPSYNTSHGKVVIVYEECSASGCNHKVPKRTETMYEPHNIETETTVIKYIPSPIVANHRRHYVYEENFEYCTVNGCSYKNSLGVTTREELCSIVNNVCTKCASSWESRYEDILKNLPSGANPMDNSELVSIMRDRYQSVGVSEKVIDQLIDTISDAPATYRDIYVYSFFEYEIKIAPFDSTPKADNRSFYSHTTKILTMNESSIDEIETWFHESGHAVDWNSQAIDLAADLIYFEESVINWSELYEALEKDVDNYIKNSINSFISSHNDKIWNFEKIELSQTEIDLIVEAIRSPDTGTTFVEREFGEIPISGLRYPKGLEVRPNIPEKISSASDVVQDVYIGVIDSMINELYYKCGVGNDYMTRDVYEGMTNGVLFSYNGHGGAEDQYWFNDNGITYKQSQEAWAEFYSAQMIQNQDAINENESYFENAYAYMLLRCDDMEKYYFDKLNNN